MGGVSVQTGDTHGPLSTPSQSSGTQPAAALTATSTSTSATSRQPETNPLPATSPTPPATDNSNLKGSPLDFAYRFVSHPGLWGSSGTALACVSQNLSVAAGFLALALYASYNAARLGSPSAAKANSASRSEDTDRTPGFFTKLGNLGSNVLKSRGVAYTVNAAYSLSVAVGYWCAGQGRMGCSFALISAGATAVSYHLNRRRDGEVAQPRESFAFLNSIKAFWDRIPAKVQSAMVQPSLWYCMAVAGLYYKRVAPILINGTLLDQVSTTVAAGLMGYGAVGPLIDLFRGRKAPDPKSFIIGGVYGFTAMGAVLAPHLGAVAAGSFALWAAGNYLNARRMQALQNGTADAAHNTETGGTNWNREAAQTYGHGPDGAVFHDSRVVEHLKIYLQKAQTILDLGCGTGCFAETIVKIAKASANGATRFIYFWDPNQAMLSACKDKLPNDPPEGFTVKFEQLGVKDLSSSPKSSVDVVLSSLVGCNLDNETLDQQFMQINRILKPGGVAIVTAPNSLDVVFTNGSETQQAAIGRMKQKLLEIGEVEDSGALEALREKFNGDPSVLRATFIHEENRIRLVTEGETIPAGAPVYRLIPGLVVPNYSHTAQEYLAAAKKFGLRIEVQTVNETLDANARSQWNSTYPQTQLGPEYESKPPFSVFVFKKP